MSSVRPNLAAHAGPFFTAGERVDAGTYIDVESGRMVRLAGRETLPATCSGRVAVYVRRPPTWAERVQAAPPLRRRARS